MARPLLALYNPVSGDRTAKQFFDGCVLPHLRAHGIEPAAVVSTERAGHAGAIVVDFFKEHPGEVAIVLGSGDGTLHEIINHLAPFEPSTPWARRAVHFILVPCGTANALFSSLFNPPQGDPPIDYKLSALDAFIANSKPRTLTLAHTAFSGEHGEVLQISAVVTSTALHASILKDSELLRERFPGIERFKVAARQNISRWYGSRVKLLPTPSSGVVHTYDLDRNALVPIAGPVDLEGPFAYFLSTTNVDRLEPAFRIAPLAFKPPQEEALDIVIVRPKRDPSYTPDSPVSRDSFTSKTIAVLTSAYEDGKHIKLRYSTDGGVGVDGDGPAVVEYFRCGGWEWIPVGFSTPVDRLRPYVLVGPGRRTCTSAMLRRRNIRDSYGRPGCL